MPVAHIVRRSTITRTPRVLQLEGLFEVQPSPVSELKWEVNLPIDERPWNIGLIVGPSGSGKSTVARELFGPSMVSGYEWPADKAVVDAFPADMGIKRITELLSSVGFSSPPSWLRPFLVLSNGEQFRATMARALAETSGLFVVDEFTSVVDRTVAQIGSVAIAKAVRRANTRFVAVSCHGDILEWLQPDWTYEPAVNAFAWRELQRRPPIQLEVTRVSGAAWVHFKRHHYLTATLSASARCFCAFYGGRPVAFASVLPFPHAQRPGWREHRTVCLPDFQGVGIGNALSEFVASLYRSSGRPYFSATGNPAMIRHRARSPLWRMSRKTGRVSPRGKTSSATWKGGESRYTAGFEYVGPPRSAEGWGLGF